MNLKQNNFSDEAIVALASVEAFGTVRSPDNARWSIYPKFDNFYYQELLNSKSTQNLPHRDVLLNNPELRPFVEKFAASKADFFDAFQPAFLRLSVLGHEDQ